jgi:hypothetical protein
MKCPYKVGDKVYLLKISIGSGDEFIPIKFINKPLEILEISLIPLNNRTLWDIELKGCSYCITSDDISRYKPY